MEYISKNLEETKEIAKRLLETIESNNANLVGLSGDLGSGKTALVKCLAHLLGIREDITSPTFVIMKKYELVEQRWKHLIHVDAYRLDSGKDLEILEFQKELDNQENLIFIEWPEIVGDILPTNMMTVKCEFIDENTRKYIW